MNTIDLHQDATDKLAKKVTSHGKEVSEFLSNFAAHEKEVSEFEVTLKNAKTQMKTRIIFFFFGLRNKQQSCRKTLKLITQIFNNMKKQLNNTKRMFNELNQKGWNIQ